MFVYGPLREMGITVLPVRSQKEMRTMLVKLGERGPCNLVA